MSNLYRLEATAAEIARHFGASDAAGLDIPAEVKPGQPGVVVRKAGDGRRLLQLLRRGLRRNQQDVALPLMIPLGMDMVDRVAQCSPQRVLAEDHRGLSGVSVS
jgi:hypothetical protein